MHNHYHRKFDGQGNINTADLNGNSFKLFWTVTMIATCINVFGNKVISDVKFNSSKKKIVNNKNYVMQFH